MWVTAEPRLDDNAALRAAAQAAGPLSLLFVEAPLPGGGVGGFHAASSGAYDPEESRRWPLGRAARAFLARSLASLDSDLVTLRGSAPGGGLLCRRGDPAVTVPEVARALGVARVLGSRRYEPGQWEEDERVAHALAKEGIPLTLLPGFLLHEPQYVRLAFPGKWTGHFGTLTPFVAACRELEEDLRPLPPPEALPPPHAPELVAAARSMPVAQLSLDGGGGGGRRGPRDSDGDAGTEDAGVPGSSGSGRGAAPGWSAAFDEAWPGFGEAAAEGLLRSFARRGNLVRYESRDRSRADARACVSRLSPYLRLGVISPRRVLHAIERAGGFAVSKTAYRRLFWRDLAYWQLHHWPNLSTAPIRGDSWRRQAWRGGDEASELFQDWTLGCTGFPLVDAAMRELRTSGYVSQSARMAAAAYVTDYANLDWRRAALHFHDFLVDGDLAINGMMWQNAAKSGLDQWGFSVSPVSRSQDPRGEYIRRWVPELAELPDSCVHEPWKAQAAALKAAGVVLGDTYPERHLALRDLRVAKASALEATRGVAKDQDSGGYDVITAPAGSTTWRGPGEQRVRVYTVPPLRGGAEGGGRGGGAHRKGARGNGESGGGGGGKGSGEKRQKTLGEAWARPR